MRKIFDTLPPKLLTKHFRVVILRASWRGFCGGFARFLMYLPHIHRHIQDMDIDIHGSGPFQNLLAAARSRTSTASQMPCSLSLHEAQHPKVEHPTSPTTPTRTPKSQCKKAGLMPPRERNKHTFHGRSLGTIRNNVLRVRPEATTQLAQAEAAEAATRATSELWPLITGPCPSRCI